MTILFTAAVALLAAQSALAEQRANKPFNTVNGRTSTAAPAPRVFTVTAPGGGTSANTPGSAQAPAVTNAMIGGAPSDGGRAFMGGRQVAARGSTGRAVRRGGKAFWTGGRKVDGGETPTTEEAPPHYSKPGALIRTTGQLPVYEKAETRTHTVDAGEIVVSKRKALDMGRGPGVHHGPKDTPPPPNPGTGASGYGTGAAANSPSASTTNDNNGSGNNGRDIPGDDDDGHGGDRARETSFNDAF